MTRSNRRSSRRTVIAGSLILLLILFAYKATTEGLSNFYAQSAHQEIARWSAPGQRFKGDEGTRVMDYLAKSLKYSPDNPWPHEEMGALNLRGLGVQRDPQAAEAAARSAYTHFRHALAERPTSPFSWASLALSKLYLGELDENLFLAIERAEQLGPWEPQVQQTVVFTGLTAWNRLTPARQAAVLRAMQRAARRDPAKIAEIAKSFSRIDLFCGLGYISEQGREVCSKISKSGSKPNRQQ